MEEDPLLGQGCCVAELLPHCDLLKASPQHRGLKREKGTKKAKKKMRRKERLRDTIYTVEWLRKRRLKIGTNWTMYIAGENAKWYVRKQLSFL